ncbi:nucleotide-diphospho-sugar transferase [Penicillium hispanicum]|uniref:nucleotide-diphospho-sugar transferase n=1 Tax=Penicillium hispanicum TaxID=1080232 RepID=UPI0025404860|nr:nucleotide-diphospho-sugar transferase [Penicillium hispanicum]KAJ5586989.1 nucleotide-diphospho-sugar transferase [Penicillium hispanicum]
MLLSTGWVLQPYFKKAALIFACVITVLWIVITLRFEGSTYHLKSVFVNEGQNAPRPRHAFATILTAEGDVEFPDVEEPYFRAARLLTFQLLRNPRTRNDTYDIPFLVLVTSDVPQRHRDILSNDGATIVPVESVERDWIHPKWGRWNDVLAKLNLWKLEEYDKITFLDADSVVFRPIHDIFDSPTTEIRQTQTSPQATNATGNMPDKYMIAGIHDPWMEWAMPPVPGKEFYEKNNYMNAGFFVLHPSTQLFDYYVSLLDTPDKFDSAYPEQNLLNCAHRTDGPMPWKDIGAGWNLKGANQAEYESGLKSIHHKWWRPIPDTFVSERIAEAVEEMEAHFRTLNETVS